MTRNNSDVFFVGVSIAKTNVLVVFWGPGGLILE